MATIQDATAHFQNVVDLKPRAVYDRIQFLYPREFPLMVPGAERIPANKTSMVKFLTTKAQSAQSIDAYLNFF